MQRFGGGRGETRHDIASLSATYTFCLLHQKHNLALLVRDLLSPELDHPRSTTGSTSYGLKVWARAGIDFDVDGEDGLDSGTGISSQQVVLGECSQLFSLLRAGHLDDDGRILVRGVRVWLDCAV